MRRWYCVYTKAHVEQWARQNLERQGFEVYAPTFTDEKGEHILFPRYIFIRLDLDRDPWHRIKNTFGVSHLVQFDPLKPTFVSDKVIDLVRTLTGPTEQSPLAPGTRVRVAGRDLTGICKWVINDRIAILTQLFGREIEIVTTIDEVKPDE